MSLAIQRLKKYYTILGQKDNSIRIIEPRPNDKLVKLRDNQRFNIRVKSDTYHGHLALTTRKMSPKRHRELAETLIDLGYTYPKYARTHRRKENVYIPQTSNIDEIQLCDESANENLPLVRVNILHEITESLTDPSTLRDTVFSLLELNDILRIYVIDGRDPKPNEVDDD